MLASYSMFHDSYFILHASCFMLVLHFFFSLLVFFGWSVVQADVLCHSIFTLSTTLIPQATVNVGGALLGSMKGVSTLLSGKSSSLVIFLTSR